MENKFFKSKIGKQTISGVTLFVAFPFLYLGAHQGMDILSIIGLIAILISMGYTTYLGVGNK